MKFNNIMRRIAEITVVFLSMAVFQPVLQAQKASPKGEGATTTEATEVESTAPEAPAEGPEISMPAEEAKPAPESSAPSNDTNAGTGVDSGRAMKESRFQASTPIGGYGEIHLNVNNPQGPAPADASVDIHRLILFVAHNFSDAIRFYSEIEIEHALVAPGGAPGEVAIEQAYIEWDLLEKIVQLRAGMVLVPMGITNQWHEPPIFNGVERPRLDSIIIPSTWREAGLGVVGEPIEGLRYEAYLLSGLNPEGFSGANGIRGGRQDVAKAITNGPAFAARVEYEPMLGMVFGASGYVGFAGANTDITTEAVNVAGVSADGRLRLKGFEARAVVAYFGIGGTDALRLQGIDVGSDLFGLNLEVGYNVFQLLNTDHALVPFARLEWLDTTMGEQDPAFDRPAEIDLVLGLGYRPIPQLVFKTDVVLQRFAELTPGMPIPGTTSWNLGVGWMF